MAQLRRNALNGRWVTIATGRADRPGDLAPRHLPVQADPDRLCPFCPGHEEATPPALETYARDGRWQVRVVPNLYPAFSGEGGLEPTEVGPLFVEAAAPGIHEVLVLSPDHDRAWGQLDDKQAGLVMAAVRDRLAEHNSHPGVAYTQMIVNHGREAGASLEHPHGQLLGIPFVPDELVAELDQQAAFERDHGDCLLCRTIEIEHTEANRSVLETERLAVICPYWSGTPYEMLVIPRRHESHLDRAAPADLVAVGRGLRDVLAALGRTIGDVAYNLVFHTSPRSGPSELHWHVHVLPRVTSAAGFEQGTGVLINIVAPEMAAEVLRSACAR